MDVSAPGAWLEVEEVHGERFFLLADHLERLGADSLARIDHRDVAWRGALEGVANSRAAWVGRYGDEFRKVFDTTGQDAVAGVARGRDGFVALGELARTARRVGQAIDAAQRDHRNRVQAALGLADEWVQRGWTNAQDVIGNLPGPLGASGESDADAERTRQAIDAANRSREAAERAVRAQLDAWQRACAACASAVGDAVHSFRGAMPDPPPPEERPWWRTWLVDPLIDDLLDTAELLRMTFTPEAMKAIGEVLAGLALLGAGASGEVGGGMLNATGAGALVGVPLNIVSWGLVVAGAGLTTKGLVDYVDAIGKGDYSYNRGREELPQREVRQADPIGDDARFPEAHTGVKHAGRSDQQVNDRLAREMGPRWETSTRGPTAESSTYRTMGDAQRFAQRVFDERRADISRWLDKATPGSTKPFDSEDLGEVTGRYQDRAGWQAGEAPRDVTAARVVLRADPAAPGGFYILTSHPIP